jgi:hypothetical protein
VRKIVLSLLVAVVLLAAMPAPAALAAAARSLEARVTAIDVQVWPEEIPGTTVVIVVGAVASSTPLPAQVTLPLPKDAQVTWAGEIFPTGDQADIERKPQVAGDKVTVTVEKSRQVQYEANVKGPVDRQSRRFASLAWTQNVPAETLQFSFKVPATVEDVKTSPQYVGAPAVNQSGEKLYSLQQQPAQLGKTTTVSIDYTKGSGTAAPSGGAKPDYLLWGLLGLLALAVIVLVAVAGRSRARGASSSEE